MFLPTKTCGACQKDLPLCAFAFKSKTTGRLQSKCKECSRAYAKQHYAANTDIYVAKARSNNVNYRQRNLELVAQSLAGQTCSICDTSENLTYYNGSIHNGQAVHQAAHGACSITAVEAAMSRSTVVCHHCLGQHFGQNLAQWQSMTSEQRREAQQQRDAAGIKPVPKGVYKAYRPVDRQGPQAA
jgi:hypothetical protein